MMRSNPRHLDFEESGRERGQHLSNSPPRFQSCTEPRLKSKINIMDDRYTIDTPENIEFAYDIAGIGSRFLAAIVDTMLIVVLEIIIFLVLGLLIGVLNLGGTTSGSLLAAL